MTDRRLLPAERRAGPAAAAAPRLAPALSRRRALARLWSQATPAVQGALAAVALTLAAERVLRAAGSVVLSVVSTAPRAPRRGARRRTVVTELTILERRARR